MKMFDCIIESIQRDVLIDDTYSRLLFSFLPVCLLVPFETEAKYTVPVCAASMCDKDVRGTSRVVFAVSESQISVQHGWRISGASREGGRPAPAIPL